MVSYFILGGKRADLHPLTHTPLTRTPDWISQVYVGRFGFGVRLPPFEGSSYRSDHS
jgi:hypothetical protein